MRGVSRVKHENASAALFYFNPKNGINATILYNKPEKMNAPVIFHLDAAGTAPQIAKMQNQTILDEIERFTALTGMAESTFGREALGDWKLITELRGDGEKRARRLYPETEAKVRLFMQDHIASLVKRT